MYIELTEHLFTILCDYLPGVCMSRRWAIWWCFNIMICLANGSVEKSIYCKQIENKSIWWQWIIMVYFL